MTDVQAKFAITLVAVGFLFAYAFPAMKEMKHNHDAVIQQVGQPYATSDAGVSNTPAASATSDDVQK